MPNDAQSREQFRRRPYVTKKYDISDSTLYRWVGEGRFPAPVKLGPGTVAWRDSVLCEFDADPAGWAKQRGGRG